MTFNQTENDITINGPDVSGKLNAADFATKLTTQSENQTFVGPLLSNFTLCGGGTVTVKKNASGQVYIKWFFDV